MKLKEIISLLETWAPSSYQEGYDNSGLLVGDGDMEITKALISLDCIESVVEEAIQENCNVVIAHHPILFGGIKQLNGSNYVERTIIKAIKNDIAIYAIHTNLDNISTGVNAMMAEKLSLINTQILVPKKQLLRKLATYIPPANFEPVSQAVFGAGAGHIGNYSQCGFSVIGSGTFMGNENSNPAIGKPGQLEKLDETKFEVIFPLHLERKIIHALKESHPYEEVAFEIYTIENEFAQVGSGMIGDLPAEMELDDFLKLVKKQFQLQTLKYTDYGNPIRRVALCGGSGSFLRSDATRHGADVFLSSDFKYHEWFDADRKLSYIDIGHYESEQFTKELIFNYLKKNALSLQSQISRVETNPVKYIL
jgi:dinuclear metal center YbgI/SA1388 family protein